MGSLPSSSAVSPQMEPKRRFWFGKLSTEWWERPPLANTSEYGEKQLINDTDSASGTNAEGSNAIPRDGANTVRLECRMHTDLTPDQRHRPYTGTNTEKKAPT